jgi:pimeloyl-ACP methyl ester carboxylesterase
MTRFDHPRLARSHVVEVDGIRTHYLEGGEGPTLVLLHGGFMPDNEARRSMVEFDCTLHHRSSERRSTCRQ